MNDSIIMDDDTESISNQKQKTESSTDITNQTNIDISSSSDNQLINKSDLVIKNETDVINKLSRSTTFVINTNNFKSSMSQISSAKSMNTQENKSSSKQTFKITKVAYDDRHLFEQKVI